MTSIVHALIGFAMAFLFSVPVVVGGVCFFHHL